MLQFIHVMICRSPIPNADTRAQRIRCAAICSASRPCLSFSLDSEGNCVTKETNDDEGYNIV